VPLVGRSADQHSKGYLLLGRGSGINTCSGKPHPNVEHSHLRLPCSR
jgi:hypothetical protein